MRTENEPHEGPELVEDLFRAINARIVELGRDVGRGAVEDLDLVCECFERSCFAVIKVAADDYARGVAEPASYIVAPGHEGPWRHLVVRRASGYVVVSRALALPTAA